MIEFSDHALRKMAQRKLKKAWIQKALMDPAHIIPGYANRKVAYKKIGTLYLAVVFVKQEKKLIVLTAHWEKNFRPPKEAQ